MSLGRKKNCKKATSYSCGNSCININKVCRKDGLQGQSVDIANRLKSAISASKTKPSKSDSSAKAQAFIDDLDKKKASMIKSEKSDSKLAESFSQELGNRLSKDFVEKFGSADQSLRSASKVLGRSISKSNEILLKGYQASLNDAKKEGNEEKIKAAQARLDRVKKRVSKTKTVFAENQIQPFGKLDEIDKDVQNLSKKQKSRSMQGHLENSFNNLINGENNIVGFKRFAEDSFEMELEKFEVESLFFALAVMDSMELLADQ